MRVLHAAHMRQPAIGVIRQMEYEQLAADELSLPWTCRFYCPSLQPNLESDITVIDSASGWLEFKRNYYLWLIEQSKAYDVLLLRYSMYDPALTWFVSKCEIPVVTMHHTLPVEELMGNGNVRSSILALAERLIGPLTLARVQGVAGVTHQIANSAKERSGRAGMPVFHYSNGVVYDELRGVRQYKPKSEIHEFIFLSSKFSSWMGLDKLLHAAKSSQRAFIVHVVGGLTPSQEKEVAKEPRFIAHGFLDHKEVEELMAKCTLGLSTFAIHRKKFTEGNTLKVREYLRAGLPVYAGYRDVFSADFQFYRWGEADFQRIMQFADEMVSVDRSHVSKASRPWIDKGVLLEKMYVKLKGVS